MTFQARKYIFKLTETEVNIIASLFTLVAILWFSLTPVRNVCLHIVAWCYGRASSNGINCSINRVKQGPNCFISAKPNKLYIKLMKCRQSFVTRARKTIKIILIIKCFCLWSLFFKRCENFRTWFWSFFCDKLILSASEFSVSTVNADWWSVLETSFLLANEADKFSAQEAAHLFVFWKFVVSKNLMLQMRL